MTKSDIKVTRKSFCSPPKRLEVTQVTHFAKHLLDIIKLAYLGVIYIKPHLITKVFRKMRHLSTFNDLAVILRHYCVTIASLPRAINDLIKSTSVTRGGGQ